MKFSFKQFSQILLVISSIIFSICAISVKSITNECNFVAFKRISHCKELESSNEKLECYKEHVFKTLILNSDSKDDLYSLNSLRNDTLETRNHSCSFRINGDILADSIYYLMNNSEINNNVEGRHRRQRQNMMMTMLFGVTALGAVLVPMGFQLLSVISGKALLLAKMALLLASINGLKRVANTGLHYGLYHVPSEVGNYYDRSGAYYPGGLPKAAEL